MLIKIHNLSYFNYDYVDYDYFMHFQYDYFTCFKVGFSDNYLWIKYYLVEFKLVIRIKIFNLRFNYVFTKYLVEFTLFN